MYEQQTCMKLDTEELNRVNMGSSCFKISISQTYYQNAIFSSSANILIVLNCLRSYINHIIGSIFHDELNVSPFIESFP